MSSKQFLRAVKQGKKGHNIGVSLGLPKLDSIIYGIQKRALYTIGADSGSGKTSFAIASFIYNLLKDDKEEGISIIYYSFEMSKEALYAKLVSLYIYDMHGVIIPYKEILSMQETISDYKYDLILSCESWLQKVDAILTIYDRSLQPLAIYATLKGWLSEFGEFVHVDEHREDYIPKDRRYKVAIWDHVGLIGGTGSKKERIDTVVDYGIYFRNKCDLTGIFVQQLNRNAKSMDRKTNGYELIGLDDFKDTSGTTDASEVVIALYFPYREKIARCEGYPIQNVLKKRFRLCQVLKNRYGDADTNIGLTFYGEIGLFKELPKPEEIGDYEPYLNLNCEVKDLKNKDKIINTDDQNKNVFKF
jgi:hypothetical protein